MAPPADSSYCEPATPPVHTSLSQPIFEGCGQTTHGPTPQHSASHYASGIGALIDKLAGDGPLIGGCGVSVVTLLGCLLCDVVRAFQASSFRLEAAIAEVVVSCLMKNDGMRPGCSNSLRVGEMVDGSPKVGTELFNS